MTRRIVLYTMPDAFRDPMELVKTTSSDRAAVSGRTRAFPLVADPPPDTMFMRATGADLGVFGEDLPSGHLMMIDAAFTRPLLEDAITDAAGKLASFANDAVTISEVGTALASGVWSADASPLRAPILQAAGFARQMLTAVVGATPGRQAVVWEYVGGRCTYAYPPAGLDPPSASGRGRSGHGGLRRPSIVDGRR